MPYVILPNEQADFLAETLAPNVRKAADREALTDDHAALRLTARHLDLLEALSEEEDGHYDGRHIWIGGTEWPVLLDAFLEQLRDVARIDRELEAAKEAIDRAIELIPSDLVLAKLTGRDRTGIWRRRATLNKTP
jgi:hypothetical protein